MSSIYDKINSTRDLLIHVKAHGLSTKQEDICRAQDIVGHEPLKNLIDLANDIGRNNHMGEPDPDGSWSSDRMPTRDLLYSVLFRIWNWEEATNFWNKYTNPATKKHKRTEEELDAKNRTISQMVLDADTYKQSIKQLVDEKDALMGENYSLKDELEGCQREIVRLKAKLYDMMMAQEEGQK